MFHADLEQNIKIDSIQIDNKVAESKASEEWTWNLESRMDTNIFVLPESPGF